MTDAPTLLPPMGFLRSALWWRLLARCLALAAAAALLALGFIGVVDRGIEWLSVDDPSNDAFSGSPWIFVTLVAAGLIIGLIYKFVPHTREVDVFEGFESGNIDHLSVPGGLGVAVTSLVSGASLGPEVPTGMLAGGMATWVSEREGWGDVERRVAVQSSVGSAWGGLFTTPFVPSLMALELQHRQSPAVWPLLMIQTLSSVAGFSIFYLAGGWAEVIRFLALPEYSFDLVDLAFAGLIGVVGAAGAMLFVILHRRLEALARPLADRPVLRSTIGGALLGLLGVALPLTLFNGAGGLAIVTSDTAELGVTLILVSAIAKIVATTTALAFGFIGGPIFPALFAGGSFGVILHEVVPSMPLAISVSGSMAAMTAALVAVPFSLSVLVMLIAGAPVEAAPPVLTAAVVSFVIVRGLAPTPPAVDPSEPTTAPPPD